MNKMNQDLFDFFSDRETYKATNKLIDSFKEFKQQLFTIFWNSLVLNMKGQEILKNWNVESETFQLDDGESSISILSNNKTSRFHFYINCSRKYGLFYGINIDDPKLDELQKIYTTEIHDYFKTNGWKLNKQDMVLSKNYIPVYYELHSYDKDLNFKQDDIFEKLLPSEVNFTIENIARTILDDFTPEIQDFILKN